MLLGRIVQFLIHQRSKSDNKAFLLIRLKKYLNPHENSCSKVMSILITDNIYMSPLLLHSNTNQYNKWFALYITPRCFAYIHAATTFYQLQRSFGAGGNMHRSRNFCHFYLILSLFYSLQRGSNSFIAETLLILYQGSRGVHY